MRSAYAALNLLQTLIQRQAGVGQPVQAGFAQCIEVHLLLAVQPGPGQQGLAGVRVVKQAVQIAAQNLAVGADGPVGTAIVQPERRALAVSAIGVAQVNFIAADWRVGKAALAADLA